MKILVHVLILFLGVFTAQAGSQLPAKNIVIVHGAFADGSGWEGVYHILKKHGYNVSIVQNPLISLAADVTATKNVLDAQEGPVVLVGHSYGGVVITQAGNDPKVKSLVYVAAFVPETGESLEGLIPKPKPEAPKVIIPLGDKFLYIDPAKFSTAFAADVAKVDPDKAQFMADSQAPLGIQAYSDQITAVAAWKSKPSYYIVSTQDQMIPPAAETMMAQRAKSHITPLEASHAVYISRAADVAKVIETAATSQ